MNLLVITPECPFPPEKNGGVHALFNLLRNSDDVKIDIRYYGDKDEEAEERLEAFFDSVEHIPRKRGGHFNRFASLLKRTPYAIYQFEGDIPIDETKYDCVLYDQFSSLGFLKRGRFRNIAFVCDSMPLYFQRKGDTCKNVFAKLYYRLQSIYAKGETRKALDCCDKMIFVSELDASYTKKSNKPFTKPVFTF